METVVSESKKKIYIVKEIDKKKPHWLTANNRSKKKGNKSEEKIKRI